MLQLVYVSAATAPLCSELREALLAQSRRDNARRGLTGVLLYGDMGFFQVLEGPEQAVLEVYGKIRRDGRHWRIATLLEREVERRSFPDWSMGADRLEPGVTTAELFAIRPGALEAALNADHDGVVRRLAGAFLDVTCRGAA